MADEEPAMVYVGATWRSRFLRAPKIGLALATEPDFVPLAALATARLGLKTGKDEFFFLSRRVEEAAHAEHSLSLVRRRKVTKVTGMDRWSGELASQDLRPAALNPHELFAQHGRRFAIPELTPSLYLYPGPGGLRADLGTYIELAERAGVPRGKLVASNGSEDAWYRQVRAVVSSPWALPYNSAYDYGAWDNRVGAVLNGRFVGLDPLPAVDSDLLGAVLNSTFAIIGRLVEGTATGVEAALDVGPPAVRRIRVPDVRLLKGEAVADIREVLAEMRRADSMPPAPSRTLDVSDERRRLDLALLRGLGRTAGQASVLVGRMYESYARWRADVEDVEQLMRQNRRQMQRSGQSRTTRPADRVGRRVWEELQASVALFPSALLTPADAVDVVTFSKPLEISASEPLFDAGMIPVHGGRPIDLGSFERVRYVGMLRQLGFESPLAVPRDATRAGAMVDRFEQERRRFVGEAKRRVAAYMSDPDASKDAVNAAERHWLTACRAAGSHAADIVRAPAAHEAPTLTAPIAGARSPRRKPRRR